MKMLRCFALYYCTVQLFLFEMHVTDLIKEYLYIEAFTAL